MSDLSLRSQLGSFHANVISIASVTGTNTSLPGNLNIQGSANVVGTLTAATASITGSLMVAGTNVTGGGLSDYQYGSLNMRVFDDTSVYARATLTSGGPLPVPFLSRPVGDTPFSTLSFSQAVFGTSVSAYSARISGYVNPPYSGTYLFRTTFQNGATLYLGLQKLCDSWTYSGSALQAIGTITLAQNVWQPLVLEHTTSSTLTEQLLLEFSTNSGSVYSTLAHGTASNQFQMAYNVKETPTALHGSSYASGRAFFVDVASFNTALILPNATSFSGRTSELTKDAGFILSGTNLSLACQSLSIGSASGSVQIRTSSSLSSTYTLSLPASLPSSSRQTLITDTAGNLGFTSALPGVVLGYSTNSRDGGGVALTTGLSFTFNKIALLSTLEIQLNITVYPTTAGGSYNIAVAVDGTVFNTYYTYTNSPSVNSRVTIPVTTIVPSTASLTSGSHTAAFFDNSGNGAGAQLYSHTQFIIKEIAA